MRLSRDPRLDLRVADSFRVWSREARRLSSRSAERSRKASRRSLEPSSVATSSLALSVSDRAGLEFSTSPSEVGIGAAEGGGRGRDLVLSLSATFLDVTALCVEQVRVDGKESLQMVSEFVLELLMALGLLGLALDLSQSPHDFADHVLEAEQILPGVLELEFSFVLARLVAGDAGSFLEQDAAIDGSCRKDLADPALFDDRVGASAQADLCELVEDVFQPYGAPVETVLRRTGLEDAAPDLEAAVGLLPVAVVGLENRGSLRPRLTPVSRRRRKTRRLPSA